MHSTDAETFAREPVSVPFGDRVRALAVASEDLAVADVDNLVQLPQVADEVPHVVAFVGAERDAPLPQALLTILLLLDGLPLSSWRSRVEPDPSCLLPLRG